MKRILVHSSLFFVTFFTTTVAGVSWLNLDPFDLTNFFAGLPYSLSILFILTCHEFGHYFAARYHKVDATLPYYIPSPSFPGFLNFGTFGAVIRTKSLIPNKRVMFDIGVAGPIAGFIASMVILAYGFSNLPGREFIESIHPGYFTQQQETGLALTFGQTLLYNLFAFLFSDTMNQFVPPMTEMYHYPFLLSGWFGLFVTAMNLIPIGQLDGGHISYTMFGKFHSIISRIFFAFLIIMGIGGYSDIFNVHLGFGWSGWLFWAMMLFFFVKLDHPPVADEIPLDESRMTIGWLSFIIFLVSFSPTPFTLFFN